MVHPTGTLLPKSKRIRFKVQRDAMRERATLLNIVHHLLAYRLVAPKVSTWLEPVCSWVSPKEVRCVFQVKGCRGTLVATASMEKCLRLAIGLLLNRAKRVPLLGQQEAA